MDGKTVVSSRSRRNLLSRWFLRTFRKTPSPGRRVLMIMGAQRSGTTLFSRVFDDLYYADVFGEFSVLSSDDQYGLRLNHCEKVNKTLAASNAALVVFKPLVESQRANYWLENIPNSIVIWLYRDYTDVASSSVVKFGEQEGGTSHARAFVDKDFASRDYAAWKSENASTATIENIQKYYSEDVQPHDSAALFWYARNILYTEQDLDHNPNVILLKYEEFVKHPFLSISYILDRCSISELKSRTLSNIDTSSIGKGGKLELTPGIDTLCKALIEELDTHFYSSPLGMMLEALDQ